MKAKTLLMTAATSLAVATNAVAEDDPFDDAFDSGFEDIVSAKPSAASTVYLAHRFIQRGQVTTAQPEPGLSQTDHRGLASLATAWRTQVEWRPTSRFDAVLDAELNQDWVFDLRPDTGWKPPYRNQRETRLELREARLAYRTSGWALSSGRQVQTWGFNDALSVLEPVNPPRMAQPGLYDADEARLSRWLTEARWYLGNWTLQGMVAHENRMAELPVYGSDYYPLPAETADRAPDHGWEDPSAHAGGVRLSGLWQGADLAAFVWRGYNPTGHLMFAPDQVERHYERLTTIGAGLSVPFNSAVIKAEIAAEDGLTWAPVSVSQQDGQAVRNSGAENTTQRLSWALGVDVTLPANSRLLIEYRTDYLPDYQPDMATNLGEEFSHRWAIGAEHSTLRERLTLSGAVLGFGGLADGGQAMRLAADWDISDQWRTRLGWVGYRAGDAAQLQAADDSDRLFWQLEWLF
ncbi:hypothetical protein [Saccharospirillum sp.]|uniref:hypothetical protein n=1 Tax=Saccharospirillum sp. TaxID=2033801 RepID=UPI0034A0A687